MYYFGGDSSSRGGAPGERASPVQTQGADGRHHQRGQASLLLPEAGRKEACEKKRLHGNAIARRFARSRTRRESKSILLKCNKTGRLIWAGPTTLPVFPLLSLTNGCKCASSKDVRRLRLAASVPAHACPDLSHGPRKSFMEVTALQELPCGAAIIVTTTGDVLWTRNSSTGF